MLLWRINWRFWRNKGMGCERENRTGWKRC